MGMFGPSSADSAAMPPPITTMAEPSNLAGRSVMEGSPFGTIDEAIHAVIPDGGVPRRWMIEGEVGSQGSLRRPALVARWCVARARWEDDGAERAERPEP